MSVEGIKVFAMAAVVLGVVAASPATSRPRDVVVTGTGSDVVTRTVKYRDLNLASADGDKKLVRRVQGAVNNVCLDLVGHHMGYMEPMAGCQAQSWDAATPQIKQAIERARDIAANGWSAIAPVAITISAR